MTAIPMKHLVPILVAMVLMFVPATASASHFSACEKARSGVAERRCVGERSSPAQRERLRMCDRHHPRLVKFCWSARNQPLTAAKEIRFGKIEQAQIYKEENSNWQGELELEITHEREVRENLINGQEPSGGSYKEAENSRNRVRSNVQQDERNVQAGGNTECYNPEENSEVADQHCIPIDQVILENEQKKLATIEVEIKTVDDKIHELRDQLKELKQY
jgi:hypothetical protein